jgi:hypothetical protein
MKIDCLQFCGLLNRFFSMPIVAERTQVREQMLEHRKDCFGCDNHYQVAYGEYKWSLPFMYTAIPLTSMPENETAIGIVADSIKAAIRISERAPKMQVYADAITFNAKLADMFCPEIAAELGLPPPSDSNGGFRAIFEFCEKYEERKRQDEDERIRSDRRNAGNCVLCGKPLGWLDRLTKIQKHRRCSKFTR